MDSSRVTLLVDNDADGGFFAEHGLSMWIETGDGVVLCTGCCHSGLVNTLEYLDRIIGGARLKAVIGGFHLLHAGEERMLRTIDALKSHSPELIVPCHCTGEAAVRALQDCFGDRVRQGKAGMILEF